jgi:hypothetical protein
LAGLQRLKLTLKAFAGNRRWIVFFMKHFLCLKDRDSHISSNAPADPVRRYADYYAAVREAEYAPAVLHSERLYRTNGVIFFIDYCTAPRDT